MTDWLLVVAGGLVGPPLRYRLSVDATFRLHSAFLGHLRRQRRRGPVPRLRREGGDGDVGARLNQLLATGFRGALSTWSTFSYALLTLTSARRLSLAAGYLLLTVRAGVGLAFAGAAA